MSDSKTVIHLVAAARPNFMKIAPLWHTLSVCSWAEPVVVHTGHTTTQTCRLPSSRIWAFRHPIGPTDFSLTHHGAKDSLRSPRERSPGRRRRGMSRLHLGKPVDPGFTRSAVACRDAATRHPPATQREHARHRPSDRRCPSELHEGRTSPQRRPHDAGGDQPRLPPKILAQLFEAPR